MLPATRPWRRFRAHRRGWYSLLVLVLAYGASLMAPLLVNDRALAVRYEGELYFPVLHGHYEARIFGQRTIGEADYRRLARELEDEGQGDWVVLAPYPFHPNESLLLDRESPGAAFERPSRAHWLGLDDRARDVFARLFWGLRTSLTIGLSVVLLGYAFGTLVGGALGFLGGRIDLVGVRLVEIWSGLPFLYTVLILGAWLRPTPSLLVVVLAAFGWVGISYYVRGEFYRERAKDYVAAAQALGLSRARIALIHVLPNALVPIVSFAPFSIVATVLTLVALDYLGFGLPAPTPSFGELIAQGLGNLRVWHLVVFPLGALLATLLLVTFVGEAAREALDPRGRGEG